MRKRLSVIFLICIFASVCLTACGGVWGGDGTAKEPNYHYVNGEKASFVLEFRRPGSGQTVEKDDIYPHSTLDGELICDWEVSMYGNTVYESVIKFFEDREDSMTFRLSQHKFYMFHDCTLISGEKYNLETVYIAADGKYANCANFQSVLGADGVAGTDDDLKVLTLVYKGWLY